MSVPPIVGGLVGAAVPAVANALGIGKSNVSAHTFDQTKAYDPNAFQYGGHPGGADEAANQYGLLGGAAQQRGAAQAANVGVNYQGANRYAGYGSQDRSQQGQAANLMMQRAQGLVPSIAQMQADRQMQQATAAQSSAAASARGAAGIAMAQQNAANNTATMQSAISNQAQINAAQERQQAEQSAYNAYSGMRGNDLASQQQAAQQSQYAAQLAAQQNQYNAGLEQQQHSLNDQYSMGMYNLQNNVRAQQLAASQNQQQMLSGSQMNANNQNMANARYNADRQYGYYQQTLGGVTGTASAAAQMMSAPSAAPPVQAPPVTGMSSGGGTNMVGVPQPGTGSDDRMKMGITPLGLLFGGGGNSAPGGSVDIGGKGYMSSDDILRGSSGLAGQTMPGMVGGGGVTGGNVDLGLTGGGGMSSGYGLLSDDRAVCDGSSADPVSVSSRPQPHWRADRCSRAGRRFAAGHRVDDHEAPGRASADRPAHGPEHGSRRSWPRIAKADRSRAASARAGAAPRWPSRHVGATGGVLMGVAEELFAAEEAAAGAKCDALVTAAQIATTADIDASAFRHAWKLTDEADRDGAPTNLVSAAREQLLLRLRELFAQQLKAAHVVTEQPARREAFHELRSLGELYVSSIGDEWARVLGCSTRSCRWRRSRSSAAYPSRAVMRNRAANFVTCAIKFLLYSMTSS
jgi:hypothetical protein